MSDPVNAEFEATVTRGETTPGTTAGSFAPRDRSDQAIGLDADMDSAAGGLDAHLQDALDEASIATIDAAIALARHEAAVEFESGVITQLSRVYAIAVDNPLRRVVPNTVEAADLDVEIYDRAHAHLINNTLGALHDVLNGENGVVAEASRITDEESDAALCDAIAVESARIAQAHTAEVIGEAERLRFTLGDEKADRLIELTEWADGGIDEVESWIPKPTSIRRDFSLLLIAELVRKTAGINHDAASAAVDAASAHARCV